MKILIEREMINKYGETVKNLIDVSSFFNFERINGGLKINQNESINMQDDCIE